MILSGRTDVSFSADTVRKVRETAEALGYAPTAKKRPSLFDRKTVLIVCPNVLNPYYSTIVQAIQQAAADKDCDTLVYTTYRDAENEIRILNAVAGSDLAGVVFTMMPQSTELVERVNRLVPVVVIGDRNPSLNVDTVEQSLRTLYDRPRAQAHSLYLHHAERGQFRPRPPSGRRARHLPRRMPRRLRNRAFPRGDPKRGTGQHFHRARGRLRADPQMPRRAAHHGLRGGQRHGGVLDAIRAEGRRVPEDYSVCGFDNIFPSQFLPVGLTTVEHYIADKGRNAFEILHSKMSGESSDRNITRVEFKHHLIVRDSTAAPRGEEKTG